MKKFIAICMTASLLTACQQPGYGGTGIGSPGGTSGINKADIGTVAGGLGGAFAGSNLGKGSGRTLGIAAGTLLGAFIGNQVGQSLDRADVMYAQQTSTNALETTRTGQQSSWRNPDSGASGTFTPTRTFQTGGGMYCREFTQTINVGGQSQQGVGTACRQPDGSWQIQS